MIKRRYVLILVLCFTVFLTFAAYSQNSSQCRLYNSRGKEFFDKGKYAEAEKLFKKAVTADFLNPLTRYNLAILYKKQKKYKKSLDNIKKAISLKPFETEYTHFLLELYILLYKESLKIGQNEQAENFLDMALKQDENFFGAHFILLERELKAKKYAEAESRIDDLIEKTSQGRSGLRILNLLPYSSERRLSPFIKRIFTKATDISQESEKTVLRSRKKTRRS